MAGVSHLASQQMLTPIKVRGKKCRQSGLVSTANRTKKQRRTSDHSPESPNFSSPPRASVIRSTEFPSKSKRRTPFERISALEKLPTELLETILFQSTNIALPRASPVIGAKLSSHHVYIHTILSVFGPTWEDRYRRIKKTEILEDSREWSESFVAGDPSMQNLVVRCRWATLDILRKAEALWLRDAPLVELEPVELTDPLPLSGNLRMLSLDELHDIEFCYELAEARWILWRYYYPQPTRWFGKNEDFDFDEDFISFRTTMESNAGLGSSRTFLRPFFKWEGLLKVHPLLEVPDSLLRGPWTDNKLKHLFYFVRAGARVDSLRMKNYEEAHKGFCRAIMEGRLDVMYLLLCLGINKDFTDTSILEWAVQNAGGNRLDVVATVFDMLKWSSYRASSREWNYMFGRVAAAAQRRGLTDKQRRTELDWSEEFRAYWLSLPKVYVGKEQLM